MLGPRITTVFRSRWRALWWGLSVLLGVWWAVPRGDEDNADQPNAKDVEAVAAMLRDQNGSAHPAKHVNPWAKDAPAADK